MSNEKEKIILQSISLHEDARAFIAADAVENWVTINGAKVLLNEDGSVAGGAGGKLNGRSFPNAKRTAGGGKSQEPDRKITPETTPNEARKKSLLAAFDKDFEKTIAFAKEKNASESQIESLREQVSAYKKDLEQKGADYFADIEDVNDLLSRFRIAEKEEGSTIDPEEGPNIKQGHGELLKPLQIKKETEKAYGVENPDYVYAKKLYEVGGDDRVMKSGTRAQREAWKYNKTLSWLPKSQVSESGGQIVGMKRWLARRSGVKTDSQDISNLSVMTDAYSPVAAGIAYCADGKYLFVRRGEGGDYPGHWAFPGGHIEIGESPTDAAIREFHEETGHLVDDVVLVGDDGHFSTFYSAGPKFDVQMCDESTGAIWTTLDALPEPMHPGVLAVLASEELQLHGMNELEIAKAIADGTLSSPQQYGNVTLFDLRITGTGVAYRSANEEYTWRNPDDYLNAEFLARCNGLPVIYVHPEKKLLDSIEFSERIVGTVLLPYISDNEVWGIAKIYDDAAIAIMTSGQMSTSPSVVTSGDAKLVLADGQECLVEGKPKIVDHLAICEIGVWDKGGPPAGVNSNQAGASTMNEDEIKAKADADAKEKEELQAKLDSALSELQEMKQAKAAAEEKSKVDEYAKKEEEEKANANSAIAAQIKALEARIPAALSDADLNSIGAAQAKADSIFSAFGVAAPKPIHGEGPGAYRRRLAASLKEHSQTYKDIDLAKADDALFGIAEAAIYADAAAAATRPATSAAGELRMRTRRTDAGHTVNEWAGDSGAYMRDFAMRPAHARINRPTH